MIGRSSPSLSLPAESPVHLPQRAHLRARTFLLLAIATLLPTSLGIAHGQTAPWRSTLYPQDWRPDQADAEGRFLHDVSYAGYHKGEQPLPTSVPGAIHDVVTVHGADPSGQTDSTDAIQATIDAAALAGGGVILLPAGTYKIDGLLTVNASGVVLRGEGPTLTRLAFTRHTDMSDKSHLTFRGALQQGPDLALVEDAPSRAFEVLVADATSLTPGDDVSLGWVISDAFVAEHGMTGTWQAFNNTWRPFFRRQVVAVDTGATPHIVTLDVPLRYPAKLRDSASLRRETGYLEECGLESLAVGNAVGWEEAWTNDRAHAILMQGVKDSWIRDVRSFSPPGVADGYHLQSGGLQLLSSKRVTVADTRMQRAQNRGGGGNGYLFEISKSSEILMRDCTGLDGRHNFIQNWDFGTSGCVFLRCESRGSKTFAGIWDPIGVFAFCDYHHSLARANLVDSCLLDDGWYAGNRGDESTGAGHTATENVYWNTSGGGMIRSLQYGWGYVIGLGDNVTNTSLLSPNASGTAPEDWVEDQAGPLQPASLYEDQLRRRLDP